MKFECQGFSYKQQIYEINEGLTVVCGSKSCLI